MNKLAELETLVQSVIRLRENRDFIGVSSHISEFEFKEDTWFTQNVSMKCVMQLKKKKHPSNSMESKIQ